MTSAAATFDALADRHRRELHVHCYRMLGSFEEAEDVVQDALLKAWRGREGFDGGPGFRAWLYRIATNCCLDALRRRARRPVTVGSYAEIPWLQPYPDRLLDELPASGADDPEAVVTARETIELAFIAVIQQLPPRQRAALLLCDVLGWAPGEAAAVLDASLGATNSALQRARASMTRAGRPAAQSPATSQLSERERELVALFIDIHEGGDPGRAAAMISDDIRVTMPPNPWCFDGRDAVLALMRDGVGPAGPGQWRLVPTRANRLPAAASYLRAWDADTFVAFKLDVLDVRGGRIAQITTFDATLFDAFGLPAALDRIA